MRKGRRLALLGARLQLSPLLGIVVPIVAMISGVLKMSDFGTMNEATTSSLEGTMMVLCTHP